jgi:hypothetical protein
MVGHLDVYDASFRKKELAAVIDIFSIEKCRAKTE